MLVTDQKMEKTSWVDSRKISRFSEYSLKHTFPLGVWAARAPRLRDRQALRGSGRQRGGAAAGAGREALGSSGDKWESNKIASSFLERWQYTYLDRGEGNAPNRMKAKSSKSNVANDKIEQFRKGLS